MSEVSGSSAGAATTGSSNGGPVGGGDSGGTSTPSTPSTHDVAAQVIEEGESDGIEVSGDLPIPPAEAPAEKPPAVAAKPPTPPPAPLSVEEQLLAEFGFTQKFKPDGREYYLPRSRVLQMIGAGLKRSQEKWSGEKTALDSKVKEYEADRREMAADLTGDPHAFLTKLARHDPRYQVFLGGHPQVPGAPPSAPPPDPYAEMPAPDLPLSDGSRTYSLEGIQKSLIPWLTQAIKADLRRERDQERAQEQQTSQQRQHLQRQNQQKVQQLMQEATTWPLFGPISPDGKLTEFQAEVMQTFMADKSLDLRAAYMKVAHPKLTTDRNAMREELLRELNSAPRSTAVSHQATERRPAGPMSTADFAARAIERLERGR